MARALDVEGSGKVAREDLREALLEHGAHPRTARRWIRQAIEAGLFHDTNALHYRSQGKAAAIVGAERMASRPAIIENPAALFDTGWLGVVWAAYTASRNGGKTDLNPISRAALEKLTGVPERTQREYQKQSKKIKSIACQADFGRLNRRIKDTWTHVNNLRKETGKGYLLQGGRLIQRLPNVYVCDKTMQAGNRGRTGKAKREMQDHLSFVRQVKDDQDPERRYHQTEKAASKAADRNGGDHYWFTGQRRGVNHYAQV